MLTTDRRPYSLLYYQLLWEASVTEVDEADGREGGHQLVCGLLHITFFQLGIVMDRQRQRRKINHRNRGHLEWTLIWFCTVTSNSWSLLHDHQKQLHRSIKHASKSLQTFWWWSIHCGSKNCHPFCYCIDWFFHLAPWIGPKVKIFHIYCALIAANIDQFLEGSAITLTA